MELDIIPYVLQYLGNQTAYVNMDGLVTTVKLRYIKFFI